MSNKLERKKNGDSWVKKMTNYKRQVKSDSREKKEACDYGRDKGRDKEEGRERQKKREKGQRKGETGKGIKGEADMRERRDRKTRIRRMRKRERKGRGSGRKGKTERRS